MNIRELLNYSPAYFTINREERNLAAIFYHVLLINNNLEKILSKLDINYPIIEEEVGIYFEYALLRDLWYRTPKEDNENKRNTIIELLSPDNKEYLKFCSVLEFNKHFGAVPVSSADYIQSPGNWSVSRFKDNISNNDEFLKTCKFKWCFNAKPDIVIHTSNNHAVCIEAKYESEEGFYPSKQSEKEEFKRRGLAYVGQAEIQKMIMQLLGIESKFIFLVQKSTDSKTHSILLWKEAFDGMDLTGCPYFITEWIKRL